MTKLISKTIYLLVAILYIFMTYISPLGIDYAVNNKSTNDNDIQGNRVQMKVETFADILGVNKEVVFKPEVYSIHQYDDQRYQNNTYEYEVNEKGIASSQPVSYSYHENEYNDKEVMGFVPYWLLSNYNNIDYSKLSSISYFALTADSGGSWVSDAGYVGFNSSYFANMVEKAHSKGVKVLLVAKNFDPLSIRNIINNSDGAGDRLINRIVSAIRSKGLDGVNVDFEYVPKVGADTVTDSLRQKFANWHAKLADRIHSEFPKAHVSTDVFGSSGTGYTIYDLEALGNTGLDYIVMMTYDYITTSCGSGSKVITPMSPLYGNFGWNTSTHLIGGANQAGSKKILMGIPYYGIDFYVKTSQRNNYNAEVDYPNCDGRIETYGSITAPSEDQYHNPSTMRWNNSEKARWYVYQYGSRWRHGYYDDALSLAAKYDFVREKKLGGIAIWVLGYDNNAKELYDVIREKFQRAPFYINFGYGVSQSKINSILSSNNLEIESVIGANTYLVIPESEVSGAVMKRLVVYKEILDVRFEIEGMQRGIE